jgi:RHS repeat-associated protein
LPSGDVIHYVHDAMGRRIGKLRNGQLVKGWLYADDLRPIAQLNAAGQLEATYVYGSRANVPDLIVENTAGTPTTYRVVADHLGTPRLVVRVSDGAVVHRLDLDEFGNVVGESGARQDLHPFGLAAGLRDRETGLVRYGARDYDPYTGRWTAKDPILFDGGDFNLYRYAFNDPVNFIDSDGKNPLGIVAACALVAYGAYQLYNEIRDAVDAWNNYDVCRQEMFDDVDQPGGPQSTCTDEARDALRETSEAIKEGADMSQTSRRRPITPPR